MKRDAGRVYRFFLLIACVTACAASGCSPIGSISGYSTVDLFWIVPNRVAYEINDLFLRKSDLRVFTSYGGVVESIPLEKVEIFIAEKPDQTEKNKLKIIPLDENYPLDTAGRKLVVVEYGGMSDNYSIEVRDPNGLGGGNGNGGEGGSGIEIEWEVPVTTR